MEALVDKVQSPKEKLSGCEIFLYVYVFDSLTYCRVSNSLFLNFISFFCNLQLFNFTGKSNARVTV